jgi:hypothetical protein
MEIYVMTKQMVITALSLGVLFLCSTTDAALAGPRQQVINTRQTLQHDRIHHGVHSGQLTRHEAMKLRQGQRNIRQEERNARADGKITRQEFRQLEKMQNRQSRAIYRNKHDQQTR